MTCVLSITSLYNNPCSGFKEDAPDIQTSACEDYDFNWISGQTAHTGSGLSASRSSSPCRVEASLGTVVTANTTYSGTVIGANLFGMCNKTESTVDKDTKQGIKRKCHSEEFEEIYVPPKRISPFLNTPKERKDERKRILKISIQKIKQLEDPEIFLRRSVLVNNTMKRLQNEIREEKLKQPKKMSSYRRKNSYSYGMLNNNCLSNSYLFDDPFLSGTHEKITDDMTDTLMSNLQDKLGDTSAEIPSSEVQVDNSVRDSSSARDDVSDEVQSDMTSQDCSSHNSSLNPSQMCNTRSDARNQTFCSSNESDLRNVCKMETECDQIELENSDSRLSSYCESTIQSNQNICTCACKCAPATDQNCNIVSKTKQSNCECEMSQNLTDVCLCGSGSFRSNSSSVIQTMERGTLPNYIDRNSNEEIPGTGIMELELKADQITSPHSYGAITLIHTCETITEGVHSRTTLYT